MSAATVTTALFVGANAAPPPQIREYADDVCEIRANMAELRKDIAIARSAPSATADVIVLSAIRAPLRDVDCESAVFQITTTSALSGVSAMAQFTFDLDALEDMARAEAACNAPIRRAAYVRTAARGTPLREFLYVEPATACVCASAPIVHSYTDIGRNSPVSVAQLSVVVNANTEYFALDGATARRRDIIREIQRGAGASTVSVTAHRAAYGPVAGGATYASWLVARAVRITRVANGCASAAPCAPPNYSAHECAMVDPRNPAWKCAQPRAVGMFCAHHSALMEQV